MGWAEAIRDFVVAFFKNLPILNKWFTKTPTEKIKDQQEDAQDANQKTKETGRPQW